MSTMIESTRRAPKPTAGPASSTAAESTPPLSAQTPHRKARSEPALSLAVQYAVTANELPRWRLRRWAQRTLSSLPDAPSRTELTLRLVDQHEGRQLNHDFRERDYATNVLTFEYGHDPDGTLRGDIVLCVPVLEREAREQGKPLLHHAAHLTVHGVLHAVGHDHLEPAQAEAMEALETSILASMGIPDPYAVQE